MRLRTNPTDQAYGHVGEWGTQKTCTAIASSWGLSEGSSSAHSPGLRPFLGLGRRERRAPGRGESPPCTSPALEKDSVWCFQSGSGGVGG